MSQEPGDIKRWTARRKAAAVMWSRWSDSNRRPAHYVMDIYA
jgi:hypothetical protein